MPCRRPKGLARLWWRAIFGCVAVQVAQALVLITAVQVFFDPQANSILGLPDGGTLLDLLICLCLFVVLLKIPGWVKRIVLDRSPFHTSPSARLRASWSSTGASARQRPTWGDDAQPAATRRSAPLPSASPGTGLAPPPAAGRAAGQAESHGPRRRVAAHPGPADRRDGRRRAGPHRTRPSPKPALPPAPTPHFRTGASESPIRSEHCRPGRSDGCSAERREPSPSGRQLGLFPPLPPTVRPDGAALPPPGPAAARGPPAPAVRPACSHPPHSRRCNEPYRPACPPPHQPSTRAEENDIGPDHRQRFPLTWISPTGSCSD